MKYEFENVSIRMVKEPPVLCDEPVNFPERAAAVRMAQSGDRIRRPAGRYQRSAPQDHEVTEGKPLPGAAAFWWEQLELFKSSIVFYKDANKADYL